MALLVGTNIRNGRWKKKGAKLKKHVVEFEEGEGVTDKIVSVTNIVKKEGGHNIAEV